MISPGPTRWPPGAERRLVPAKSNLKPQTSKPPRHHHHAIKHHLPPPLHRLTTYEPRYTPIDQRGAAHQHWQHQGLVGAPRHHQQPPDTHPIQASSIHRQPLPTDRSPTRTPMRPPPTHTSTPQRARNCKDRTARTRNTHTTGRDAQTPSQRNTRPAPPPPPAVPPPNQPPPAPFRRPGHRPNTQQPTPAD